ncbi:SulP family inorganic anion transporter [Ascidiimonas aurantiaca]|uniref:SulP family inorganic anion transporter n=1 Tax=Ascidiimonas aurantiaca TaxID=1685432 RepID=UPI0030EBCA9B
MPYDIPSHKAFLTRLPRNIFSGFVVSLIALPLGLVLAAASEAPPMAGIIAAIVGGIVVSFLGGSHVTITGPGNGLVIIFLGAITTLGKGDLYQGYLITLAAVVISGGFIFLLGLFRLGILSDFFPASAIHGMLAAIGIGIFAKQFHVMLGQPETTGSIPELLFKIPNAFLILFQKAPFSLVAAAITGIASLIFLVLYQRIRNKYVQFVPAPMWVVIIVILISYYFEYFSSLPYPIEPSLLISIPEEITQNIVFPDFSKWYSFEFWGTVTAITLVASIESLLSIKAVDKLDRYKRRSHVNKDLKALGLASVASGFVGGLNVVTVIARSSVNVNNGATNRSSNFIHAVFLILFIVIFGDQLRRVPLPALASILVYTGFKLAAPESILNISRIGKEQLLIFTVTLFSTLATNLITGIAIGVATTFLIHVALNQSFSLFFNNFRKPNVLMFKEEKGNYYVSVKNFSSYLNFYRLKRNLDAIPESAEVILDFSKCDFVDHTVLENVNNYREAFTRKGGHFDVIGLDRHQADTIHPFAIRKILPSKRVPRIGKHLTKRQSLLENIASSFSWKYEPVKQKDCGFLDNFLFFDTKTANHIYNELKNNDHTMRVFDIEYSEGIWIAKEVVHTTMMYIELNTAIPTFTLNREGLMEKVSHWAGYSDINIQEYPDFSSRFYLYSETPENVKSFFTNQLILFFESNPYYHIESNGKGFLVKGKERLFGTREIKNLIDFGIRLHALIKKIPNC